MSKNQTLFFDSFCTLRQIMQNTQKIQATPEFPSVSSWDSGVARIYIWYNFLSALLADYIKNQIHHRKYIPDSIYGYKLSRFPQYSFPHSAQTNSYEYCFKFLSTKVTIGESSAGQHRRFFCITSLSSVCTAGVSRSKSI